jgi:pyridoxamine 5'-phosphate oxidase
MVSWDRNFGGVEEVNAMTVATIGLDGFPKARVVCWKNLMRKDLYFTQNYNLRKVKQSLVTQCLFVFFGTVWSGKL